MKFCWDIEKDVPDLILGGVFLSQCLDHNSAPLRSFETKIWPSEEEFRAAGREIGPELWSLDFHIENIEIHTKNRFVVIVFSKNK